jgi:tRNA A-37 threonylcarbamoyl transferase component Bud32
MHPETWRKVEEHFNALVLQPESARQAGLLAIPEPDIRREVELLLRHSTQVFPLEGAIADAAAELTEAQPFAAAPQRIGAYRIIRRIGRGGQGAVYEAERDDGAYHKRVAIKIIPWDLDSEATRESFRRERALLAQLEHPCIARLLDGGSTPDGTPYLVMEFVEGQPLTEAASGWTLEARLRLFLKVAETVEYAHRHLIVHRDLKPNNVLVTAEGTPKLLDFGIAKLLDRAGPATATQPWALTPDYASPEQVLGQSISTASDVYSLGILLYELLTGARPYHVDTNSPLELHRLVCQAEPPSPRISPDLDSIILMALRKEPERRYRSVRDFASDIERFLARKPVSARPDSLFYRARKYAARNWLPLAAASAALAGVLAAAGVAVYQARSAQRQAEIARTRFTQLRGLTRREIFGYYEDLSKLRGTASVREAMMADAVAYLDQLANTAADDPALLGELAAAYQRAGDAQGNARSSGASKTEAALASYSRALALHQRAVSLDPTRRGQFARFLLDYTDLLRSEYRVEDAREIARQSVEQWKQMGAGSPQNPDVIAGQSRAWYNLGRIAADNGMAREALTDLQQSDELANALSARRGSNDDLSFALDVHSRLAAALAAAGRLDEALARFDEAVALEKRLAVAAPGSRDALEAPEDLYALRSEIELERMIPSRNNPAGAAEASRKQAEELRRLTASDPADEVGRSLLASALYRQSFALRSTQPARALQFAREALTIVDQQSARLGASASRRARRMRTLQRLAEAQLANGRMHDALLSNQAALGEYRALSQVRNNPFFGEIALLECFLDAAEIYARLGESTAALGNLQHAEQAANQLISDLPNELTGILPASQVHEAAAEFWRRRGDSAQARQHLNAALALWQKYPEQNPYVKAQTQHVEKLLAAIP